MRLLARVPLLHLRLLQLMHSWSHMQLQLLQTWLLQTLQIPLTHLTMRTRQTTHKRKPPR